MPGFGPGPDALEASMLPGYTTSPMNKTTLDFLFKPYYISYLCIE